MKLRKKVIFKFSRLTEPLHIQKLERISKITEMVQQGKTDGKLVQTMELTTDNYEDRNLVVYGHRLFKDQEAAEEFRNWWLDRLTEYKIIPDFIEIVDVD